MEFHDIRTVETRTMTIEVENGKVENITFDASRNRGFRVLKNGFWGVFDGNVSKKEGLYRAERNAVFESNSAVAENSTSGKYRMPVKEKAEDVPVDEKVEMLKDLAKVVSEAAVSTRVFYIESLRRFEYEDSCGSEVYYEVPRIGVSILGVAKGETLQFYSKRVMSVGGYEKLKNVFEVAEDVKEVLSKLIHASPPPSGEMNVVMDQNLAGVFVHEAFGHAVEADHVLQGSSVLAGKLGEPVAAETVTICDDPTIHEFGFYPFDDEGVKAEMKIVVENGVLRNFLHSRETAAKIGGRAGNARAQGVSFPIPRMSNTYLLPPDDPYTFDELLEECGDGIYLVGSRGGETDPATGYFHFNACYGYKVERGEIGEMVRDVSLSGNTLEILRNVKIGKNLEFDPGFCGKASQTVPVSDGSPPVLCRAIVGGM